MTVADLRPSVAVVINNYNLERFLGAAVESVLSQVEPPDEILVVDDGSTDGSRARLATYGSNVRVIHQENQGQAGAFNTGLANVTSDVVMILDADDLLLPSAVGNVRRAWRRGAAKLHWPMQVVDSVGALTGRLVPQVPLPQGRLAERLLNEGPSVVVLGSPPTSGNAFSRSALQPFLPIDVAAWPEWPDTYLLTVAPLAGDVLALETPLSCYRIHESNSSAAGGARGQLERAVGYIRDSGRLLQRLHPDRVTAEQVEKWTDESWPARGRELFRLIEREVPATAPLLLLDDWETGWTEVEGRPVRRPGEMGAAEARYVVLPWWHPYEAHVAGVRSSGGLVSTDRGAPRSW